MVDQLKVSTAILEFIETPMIDSVAHSANDQEMFTVALAHTFQTLHWNDSIKL